MRVWYYFKVRKELCFKFFFSIKGIIKSNKSKRKYNVIAPKIVNINKKRRLEKKDSILKIK